MRLTSRKFLGFLTVLGVACYALNRCLESKNPNVIGIMGAFAGIISAGIGFYTFSNAKSKHDPVMERIMRALDKIPDIGNKR